MKGQTRHHIDLKIRMLAYYCHRAHVHMWNWQFERQNCPIQSRQIQKLDIWRWRQIRGKPRASPLSWPLLGGQNSHPRGTGGKSYVTAFTVAISTQLNAHMGDLGPKVIGWRSSPPSWGGVPFLEELCSIPPIEFHRLVRSMPRSTEALQLTHRLYAVCLFLSTTFRICLHHPPTHGCKGGHLRLRRYLTKWNAATWTTFWVMSKCS